MTTTTEPSPKERIKHTRAVLGITRKEFGERSGISANTLRAWENGVNPISPKVAKKLAQGFSHCGLQCQPEWILSGVGISPREFNRATKYTHMNETIAVPDMEWDDALSIIKEIQFFEFQHTNAIVVAISNDSMEPLYSLGEYVAGIAVTDVEIDNLVGQNCIIEDESGCVHVRKLQKGMMAKTYTCYALNPKTTAQEPVLFNIKVNSAAKIIWHRKQL